MNKTKVRIKKITKNPNESIYRVFTDKGIIFTSTFQTNTLDKNMTDVDVIIWSGKFKTYKNYIHAAVVLKDPRANTDIEKVKQQEVEWDNIYNTKGVRN